MQLEQSAEIKVTPIHHVESTGFDGQYIEHLDIGHLAFADVDKSRDRTAQIQQRVQLYRRLGAAERCPIEQAQTQVDGGRVQGVDSGIELQPSLLLGIEIASPSDQAHGQRVINTPVALVQRIRDA